tara:strand:- start:48 stop:212 length:165 start_codon:yes stop_codon:yes gene_type:complete
MHLLHELSHQAEHTLAQSMHLAVPTFSLSSQTLIALTWMSQSGNIVFTPGFECL